MRLALFGPPAVEHDGERHALPFERRWQLVAYLAFRREWTPRAELASLLWPDLPPKLAHTNLRKTVFRLKSLPAPGPVTFSEGAARLSVETDVAAFEAAIAEGRYADAVALRRGELLAGFDDDANEAWTSWLRFERDRLRTAWREAAFARLRGEIDPAEALELAGRLLDADPLDEAALSAQLDWLLRSGQAARARTAFDAYARRIRDELGLEPGLELAALFDAPAARPRPSTRPALARGDGFVGRSIELRRVAEILDAPDARLVSILGPGGIGKTAFAQRLAIDLSPRFAGGSRFVRLDDLSEPAEIGGRLAEVLDVDVSAGEPIDCVLAALRDREMLVVLDNFEHLAEGAPLLERMLDACPGLTLLVTSRARLGLPSEHAFPLDGLPCPEDEDRDRLEAFDAARLFVESARRVAPAFAASSESAAIVDICRQVDGHPLALKLAAAWTRVLSCADIAAELRRGTELLRTSDATVPTRHASIDVVFERSWARLAPAERDALARLAVFRGGSTVEAARSVAGASPPVLGALADRSLLRKDDARVHLHPLVQQYVATRLAGDDPGGATERAHALYFHRLLTSVALPVRHGDRGALAALERDLENCRAGWRWAAGHGAPDLLRSVLRTFLDFCDHRGRYADGIALFEGVLSSPAVEGDPSLRRRLLSVIAHLQYRLDRFADAEASASAALADGRAADEPDTHLQAQIVLGSCALRLADYERAGRCFRRALAIAPQERHPHNAAAMFLNLALIEKALGRFEEARSLHIRSMHQYERLGDVGGQALCCNNLGDLELELGNPRAAVPYLREGLALCDRHGLVGTRMLVLANLSEASLLVGDDDDAESHARRALDSAEPAGNRAVGCVAKLVLARLALRRRDLRTAQQFLADAADLANVTSEPSLQVAGVLCWAGLLEALGEPEVARRVLAALAVHPLSTATQREECRRRLAAAPAAPVHEAPVAPIDLPVLCQRIASEAGIGYSALIADWR